MSGGGELTIKIYQKRNMLEVIVKTNILIRRVHPRPCIAHPRHDAAGFTNPLYQRIYRECVAIIPYAAQL